MVSLAELESLSPEQLRQLAEVRDVPLPPGRLSKPRLIELLRAPRLAQKKAASDRRPRSERG
jgi:hypothetical protein